MNKHQIFASFLLFIFPLVTFAGWQVTTPGFAAPREPFFQAGPVPRTPFIPPTMNNATIFPNQFAKLGTPAPVFCISISGSLRDNLERILGRYRWRVIWKAPFDYNFDGRITGSSLQNVVGRLLQPFPLQAVMYMSNRTVIIVPRFKG